MISSNLNGRAQSDLGAENPEELMRAKFDTPKKRMLAVGIDASRNRSGGCFAHLNGLISGAEPRHWGIDTVHIWAGDELLSRIGERSWLVKHTLPHRKSGIIAEVTWQAAQLPREARRLGVDVMLNSADGSACSFRPCVTMSRNMLPFDKTERERLPIMSRGRLRLELLRLATVHRMKRSDQVVFLSEYARSAIGGPLGKGSSPQIPHGVDRRFFEIGESRGAIRSEGTLNCLYVSNVDFYKHQWHVVEAISMARLQTGLDLRLRLVGGGSGRYMNRLQTAIKIHDPEQKFTELLDFLPRRQILEELRRADLFIFASSCENLPNTLLEAMAARLPIVSSDRGPMPELLGPEGFYFDPERPASIAKTVSQVATNASYRERSAQSAFERAQRYTWTNCAAETWKLLAATALGPQLDKYDFSR
jgi:glycosyltransferase involved in cell wall biosynthesis